MTENHKPERAGSASKPIVWPTISHDEVFHIGSFDPTLKGQTHNRTSLEGNGLSVSVEPEAWRDIARLGGEPTWGLRSPEAALFLDVHRLRRKHWTAVTTWAAEQGLVAPTEVIEVSWFDDEADQRRMMEFDGEDPKERAAAQAEFEYFDGGDPQQRSFASFKATPAMTARIGFEVAIALVKDLALTLYIEDVLFDSQAVHGAWWEDELNVFALSAPRGVIHARALARWDRELVEGPILRPSDCGSAG